jgi:hypothetical protein
MRRKKRVRERERGDILDDLWRNHFTGSTPGCETVEDDDLVLEGFAEGSFAVFDVLASCLLTRRRRIDTYDSILWTPILTIEV